MMSMFTRMAALAAGLSTTAGAALAQSRQQVDSVSFYCRDCATDVRSVPEIDASTGLLALAAMAAAVLLVWERRRRADV